MNRLSVTYPGDKVFAVFGHHDVVALRVREVDGLLLDQLVHFGIILRARVEGREPHNHLVSQNTEGPPVHGEGVAALDQDLGSQVVGGSAERERLRISFEHLRQPEVGQANVPVLVHQDIFRLQIAVDDVFRVQVAQGHGDLNGIEAGALLREASDLAEVHEELAAAHEAHDEENLLLRLEDVAHANKEGVIRLQ